MRDKFKYSNISNWMKNKSQRIYTSGKELIKQGLEWNEQP